MDSLKHTLRRRRIIMLNEYIKTRSGGSDPCFANALSYITGIPREGIPNFIQHEDFWAAVDSYLYSWDLKLEPYEANRHPDVKSILHFGTNARGVSHCVVYEDDAMAYDSYPSGGALVTTDVFVVIPSYTHPQHDMGEISDGC